jgi:hypothetical protein
MFSIGAQLRQTPARLPSRFCQIQIQIQPTGILLCCTGTPLEPIRIRLSLTRPAADSNATRIPSGCDTILMIQRSPTPGLIRARTSGAEIRLRRMTMHPDNSATRELRGMFSIRGRQPIMQVPTGEARTATLSRRIGPTPDMPSTIPDCSQPVRGNILLTSWRARRRRQIQQRRFRCCPLQAPAISLP